MRHAAFHNVAVSWLHKVAINFNQPDVKQCSRHFWLFLELRLEDNLWHQWTKESRLQKEGRKGRGYSAAAKPSVGNPMIFNAFCKHGICAGAIMWRVISGRSLWRRIILR